jgi:regulatory protein
MSRTEYTVAKLKIEAYCAYQERCSYEVQEKLKKFDLNEDEIQKLIRQLEKDNFLNDLRFARSYASGKFAIKSWGRIKIRSHLSAKHLPKEIIESGLQEIDESAYRNRLKELAERKKRELQNVKNPWLKRQKILRFLASKGYEPYLIHEVL